MTTALVTWRTGGIEIAVVIHAAVNTVTLLYWLVLHADLSDRFVRVPGSVTPALIIPSILAFVAILAIVWLRTRGDGPITAPGPPVRAADGIGVTNP
ncbi:hypothetical protein [Microbacterium sp. NPDC089695]|uniref:hypothetical protein n=1 Tax=Microbacterium sp. NPDC089695 TaxID=3364198 RepID=UPI00380D9533